MSNVHFVDAPGKGIKLLAPASGEVLPLSRSKQVMISSGMLGDGVVLAMSGNCVCAPTQCKLSLRQPTAKQIKLTTKHGLELLFTLPEHIETLMGHGLNWKAKQGEQLHPGQAIFEFDPLLLRKHCTAPYAMSVTVLNYHLVQQITCHRKRVTAAEDVLLTIHPKQTT
ncbi:PTS sugar transporter subunit IIA [Algicola sagamiensis]|uniref:PTS sugar transporter subunit IIA n=1 Tax=Algicola sagamiensis TaxID=163869 RepID=UPI00036CD547|nr:PTS glucose transporter subunit IIA [Algicola sagamiensis]